METKSSDANKLNLATSEKDNFRFWLQSQLTERCRRNARFSLRAFAKVLKMDASSLSQIMSGKRPISKTQMTLICEKLGASSGDLMAFGLDSSNGDNAYFQVSLDTFSVISDWYHYAILELTFAKGFQSQPKWIAKTLSISTEEAKAAVDRLLRIGLLREQDGKLVKTSNSITNESSTRTSSAHRELQRQVLKKALTAIDDCEPEKKDITSMTMAIDERNLPLAREIVRRFRRELCQLLERGEPTTVFNLGIQLYPVSQEEAS